MSAQHASAAPAPAHGHDHHHADGEVHPHVAPWGILLFVLFVLLVMTGITVYTALEVNLGAMGNTVLALLIAVFKAALVVGFFMHLHWDNKFNAVVLLFCLLAAMTFMMFTVIDLGSRGAIDPRRNVMVPPDIVTRARENAIAAGQWVPPIGEHGADAHAPPADGHAAPADAHQAPADGHAPAAPPASPAAPPATPAPH